MKNLRTSREKRREFVLKDIDSSLLDCNARNASLFMRDLREQERQIDQITSKSRRDSTIRVDLI